MAGNNKTLIKAKDLVKYFPMESGFWGRQRGNVHAVDKLNFNIYKGECLGLVGESGCGKTTTGRLLLRLIEPTSGNIFFEGEDIGQRSQSGLKSMRKDMQIIFQDPYASLDPRKTIQDILEEPLRIHKIGDKINKRKKILQLLKVVGLLPEYINRFPHEFSGGQRQRIGIARALILDPKFIVCDEPVSALDVSIQAQILNLLKRLQKDFSLTYLFIAHNLSVVKHIGDRIAVMYLGKIVEIAGKRTIYENPLHPYTQALLSAIPLPDPKKTRKREHIVLEGDVPSPIDPPQGCRFHTRCMYAKEICEAVEPELKDCSNIQEEQHMSACHFSKDFLN